MFHEKQFITQETPSNKPTNNTILSVAIPSMYSSRVLFFFVYDLCAITMGQKLTCVLHGQININLNILRLKQDNKFCPEVMTFVLEEFQLKRFIRQTDDNGFFSKQLL